MRSGQIAAVLASANKGECKTDIGIGRLVKGLSQEGGAGRTGDIIEGMEGAIK
jgi:hypothetical protein